MAQNFIYLITHTDIKNTIHVYSKKIQELNKGKSEIFSAPVSHHQTVGISPKTLTSVGFPLKPALKPIPQGGTFILTFPRVLFLVLSTSCYVAQAALELATT